MGTGFWLKVGIALVVVGVLTVLSPVLGVAAIVGGVAIALGQNVVNLRRAQEADVVSGLSLDSQARLRPLLQVRSRLADVAERNQHHPAIKIIGGEALEEADALISKSASLLQARTELLRAGKTDDRDRIETLRAQMEAATDLQEKDRLQTALAIAEGTQDHNTRRQAALNAIDSQLEEARAVLEKLHAELAASVAEGLDADEDLRDTLGRLKSLGTSLDEAEELLRDTR